MLLKKIMSKKEEEELKYQSAASLQVEAAPLSCSLELRGAQSSLVRKDFVIPMDGRCEWDVWYHYSEILYHLQL